MGLLYLIRHGTTKWNIEKRYMGQTDIPLCREGVKESYSIARFFGNNGQIDYIVTSPLQRAVDMASAISSTMKLPVEIDENLSEMHFGLWEGLTSNEIRERYPEEGELWFSNPNVSYVPGGENYEFFEQRVKKVFRALEKKASLGNIAVVTHGGPLRLYLGNRMNLPDPSEFLKLEIPRGSISKVACNNSKPVVVTFADTSHLDADAFVKNL